MGGFVFFNPDAKTYMPPDAGDPLVKPKGTRVDHPSQKLDFLDFLDFVLRVGGPTPPGMGVAYPHIVPTSP